MACMFLPGASSLLDHSGKMTIDQLCDDASDGKAEDPVKKQEDKSGDQADILIYHPDSLSPFLHSSLEHRFIQAVCALRERHYDVFTPPPEA